MHDIDDLGDLLYSIDGRGYPTYKRIAGSYQASGYVLVVEHVQGDPFAEPSRFRLLLEPEFVAMPTWVTQSPVRRLAAADYLNRMVVKQLQGTRDKTGSGKSGLIEMLAPGQEVLARTSLFLDEDGAVEARLRVGLPAQGRRILGKVAEQLLLQRLDQVVYDSLRYEALSEECFLRHVHRVEDSRALRKQLAEHNLVAFVPEGAVLPRASGVDERCMLGDDVVPFRSPESMKVTLQTPNAGPIEGMGVPEGIVLIVGGGYHGKSTLLRALERGIYDHVPDDGREALVTRHGAVKIRAEDGRSIAGTDISNFIGELPGGQDTGHFVSQNASGSTSQAAAIVEALEVGAECLLLDEDTCATNFMIRDARMQRLVEPDREPITPFVDRIRQLYDEKKVSTVLVVGGAGDYFDVADHVIEMHRYRPYDRSDEARVIAAQMPTGREALDKSWSDLGLRSPLLDKLDFRGGKRHTSIRVRTKDMALLGREEVDLGAIEQIVEKAQVRAIAHAIVWAQEQDLAAGLSWQEFLDRVMAAIETEGLQAIQHRPTGDFSEFRIFELAAFLARVRTLETSFHPMLG